MRSPALPLLLLFALGLAPAQDEDWGPPSMRAGSPSATVAASPAERRIPSQVVRQTQLLKLRADGLYRARKYREAAGLYAACARLDPEDAAARNDQASCYQKLGLNDSALLCAREALRLAGRSLASRDTAAFSFADLRARKSAYFILDKLGKPMTTPKPGQCESWTAAEGECRARMHVCAERGSRPAPGGTLRWDILRAGVARLNALFTYDEVEVPSQIPRPELRDMEESSIDGLPESGIRWINRDSAATLPLGDFLETADPACTGPACGALEKERTECRVLHFDPCAGVIGMACAYQEEGGSDRVVVGEYYILPAR